MWDGEKEDGLYNDFMTGHASCGLRCHLNISKELYQGRRRTMKEMSRHERRLCLASMLSMALPAVVEKGAHAKYSFSADRPICLEAFCYANAASNNTPSTV